MEIRNSFIFYRSYYDAISELPAEEQGQIYKAIIDYAIAGIEPNELTAAGKMCFKLIKPTVDAALSRYDASVANGKKGGRPKGEKTKTKPNQNPDETQKKPRNNLEITQEESERKPNSNLNKDIDMDIDEDIDIEQDINNIFYKESKKELDISAGARTHEKTKKKLESYDQVMEDMCVTHFGLKEALFEFIRHCQLNKRMVTNEKLRQMILRLDFAYNDDVEKMKAVKKAINSGYFDIPELRDGI